MNRKIKQIDINKWYHLESLKKHFVNCKMKTVVKRDNTNKEFTFVKFGYLFEEFAFITHPKTKRLRSITHATYEEVGFNY